MSTDEQLCRQFSLDEIKEATNNFNAELNIGKGGFGSVYLGGINNGEKFVAIKRLSSESNQGDAEFLREIETLSRLQHDNLVRLEGYCNESNEKILVYEYMQNGTLDDHLYKSQGSAADIGVNQPYHLTWEERLNISISAAQGLDYLHSGVVPRIIHRDIKDSNILIDSNLRAKIADFGLAKLVKVTGDPQITSVSTTIFKGTFGYMDPEYFYTQKLTTKTDVYAFGVVLLVILSGRKAVDNKAVEDQRSLPEWAMKCITKKKLGLIIDPYLAGRISSKSLQQFVKIIQKCLCRQSEQRPTMKEVVAGLQLALKKQPTTSATSTRQPGGRSSSTQMAEAKLRTIQKERIMKEVFGGLQLALPKQPTTTSGTNSWQTGRRSSWTQKIEAHLRTIQKETIMKDTHPVGDIIRRLLEGKGRKQVKLSEAETKLLCVRAQQIFLSQPNLLQVKAPIKICSDLNGHYQNLLSIFEFGGFPPSASYLFLGNYVDHSVQRLDTIFLLLAYKILYPDKVFLLRGESDGFFGECDTGFFNCLPVAALVGGKIFCVHGGLSPKLKHMKQIKKLQRPTTIPKQGLLRDLLWSSPYSKINGWGGMDSGHYSYMFGPDKVAEFLKNNDFDLVCRSGSVGKDGYKFFAERGLVTICSTPGSEDAVILTVDESMMCSFEKMRCSSFQVFYDFRPPNLAATGPVFNTKTKELLERLVSSESTTAD